MVPFPQALGREEKETLAALVQPIGAFMAKVPSQAIDERAKIPEEVMAGLRELGLFGLQIQEEYGGLGLSNTAYARIAEEIVMDPSIAVTLSEWCRGGAQ
jgi:acyl-CoA dehydrogenase family protein 9